MGTLIQNYHAIESGTSNDTESWVSELGFHYLNFF